MLNSANDDRGPVIRRKPLPTDNNLDMTPMIDVTFLLLIFFLVSSNPDVQAALDLPKAEHGVGIIKRAALVISVAQSEEGSGVTVYLADVKSGEPLPAGRDAQKAAVRSAVEDAAGQGTNQVLIQAERRVRQRDVARMVRAATVPGVSVNFAVMEAD
jgi:biopolymer transport protein ExbD